jgi:hypothetical protein
MDPDTPDGFSLAVPQACQLTSLDQPDARASDLCYSVRFSAAIGKYGGSKAPLGCSHSCLHTAWP